MQGRIIDVKISEVRIGTRERKDHGDLAGLAASIKEHGLLQPIGVTPDHELVFGERRLRAYRDVLGRGTIPARIVEVRSVLLGQIAENTVRKEYTVSERVAIVESLRSFSHGGDRRSKQVLDRDVEPLTVDQAAKLAGLGGKDGYFRAKAVVEKGVPELVEAMDRGEIAVSAAAKIVELPPEDQAVSARSGRAVAQRDANDFYPTPESVTQALLEREDFGGSVWEPACGTGAISEVLRKKGYEVYSSDLIERGYGEVGDFLKSSRTCDSIVTNPPFRLADEFVEKALVSATRKVAIFLPLTFLEGQHRHKLLSSSPLKTVYVFAERVSLYKAGAENRGNGRVAFSWFVWAKGYEGPATIQWLTARQRESGCSEKQRASQVAA